MAGVVFTQPLLETIRVFSKQKKGFDMDEQFENETVVNESVTYDDTVAEPTEAGNGIGLKLIGAGVAATGVAAGLAWKKFGPAIKAKANEVKIKRLNKKNEHLANKQLAIQSKLNQMQTASENAEEK